MLGFAQLGARRNHAQKMETKLLIGKRMSFVSSLELTLPVFYFNFVTNRRQCTPKFAVALYIGTLFRKFLKNFILFHFIFYVRWKNDTCLSGINQCLFRELS